MRNMRESYDQIGAAAEAYNTGKTELAANITSKGVQASATETLPELAEKVAAITQESYTIDGGEMYAKQLFGSLKTPNYWNLYEVLAQLLSDGRLVQYGGILLAEYYRGYDSLALAGAGAGGAYVVSDKDENGQFKMYTEDTTHTWATEFDGKGNRWVAYCFADEYHDFQITDTNTSPRSIFIGRKVGTITSLVNGRASEIVVPDGNKLRNIASGGHTQNYGKNVVFRNIEKAGGNFYNNTADRTDSIYLECDEIDAPSDYRNSCICNVGNANTGLKTVIIKTKRKTNIAFFGGNSGFSGTFYLEAEEMYTTASESPAIHSPTASAKLYFKTEYAPVPPSPFAVNFVYSNSNVVVSYIFLGYITNDRNKEVVFRTTGVSCAIFELQDGWLKPLDISRITAQLSAESIALNILDRLGDNTGQSQLTLKLGATALATIQNSEEYSSYLTDAIDNKNWNVIA